VVKAGIQTGPYTAAAAGSFDSSARRAVDAGRDGAGVRAGTTEIPNVTEREAPAIRASISIGPSWLPACTTAGATPSSPVKAVNRDVVADPSGVGNPVLAPAGARNRTVTPETGFEDASVTRTRSESCCPEVNKRAGSSSHAIDWLESWAAVRPASSKKAKVARLMGIPRSVL